MFRSAFTSICQHVGSGPFQDRKWRSRDPAGGCRDEPQEPRTVLRRSRQIGRQKFPADARNNTANYRSGDSPFVRGQFNRTISEISGLLGNRHLSAVTKDEHWKLGRAGRHQSSGDGRHPLSSSWTRRRAALLRAHGGPVTGVSPRRLAIGYGRVGPRTRSRSPAFRSTAPDGPCL